MVKLDFYLVKKTVIITNSSNVSISRINSLSRYFYLKGSPRGCHTQVRCCCCSCCFLYQGTAAQTEALLFFFFLGQLQSPPDPRHGGICCSDAAVLRREETRVRLPVLAARIKPPWPGIFSPPCARKRRMGTISSFSWIRC